MTDQAPAPVVDNAQTGQQPAAPAPTGGEQPWYSTIQDESIRGYAELKGWKDPSAAIDSYRNLEKLRGVPEHELLRMPKEGDQDAWGQFYSRLGRPETPDAYELPVPDGDDGAFAGEAAKWMHEAGLSKSQAHKLAEMNNQFITAQVTQYEANLAAQQDREMGELKTEWGSAYDQNVEIARRGAKQFGMAEKMLDNIEEAIGTKAMLSLFHNIGSKIGEHQFKTGEGDGGFILSPAAAKERIAQLNGDREWANKYLSGGQKEKSEMERLMRQAYPEN